MALHGDATNGEHETDDLQHEDESSESVEDLLAQATAYYAQKEYRTAAEFYSRATELQAAVNGEMSTSNADLLYLYGRCLYHVAVQKSDVLGSKVAGESSSKSLTNGSSKQAGESSSGQQVQEEAVATMTPGLREDSQRESNGSSSKPYFQFQGDENFDNSEDEDDANGENAAEEEEDEFQNAFEILDLARILLQRKVEELETVQGLDKDHDDVDLNRQLKEKLADTHDLQAEISLEGEQFPNAVKDLRAALAIKKTLYSTDSSYLAELHYKLSLALEFASMTQQKGDDSQEGKLSVAHVDEGMREEAAKEMEAAISSCKLRIVREQDLLDSGLVEATSSKSKITQRSIDEVKDMVQDMEQRLVELRQPPVSINDPKGTGSVDGATPLNGILGAILGETPEQQKARIEQATRHANDLTGLVKRKKPEEEPEESDNCHSTDKTSKSSSKRKVNFAEEVEELGTGKRAKVEDGIV